MQHEASWLQTYLVSGVEDPRLNLQSILARHFLLRAIMGERFSSLMEQEYRFSAVMNWLVELSRRAGDAEELAAVLYALKRGADNAEGVEIPRYVLGVFAKLPAALGDCCVPNYIESFLSGTEPGGASPKLAQESLGCFERLWHDVLDGFQALEPNLSVLEPACGSANDYRFLESYGLARLLSYSGFDLCAKNVDNARMLFPAARFDVGNVFAILAGEKTFDFCVVHDLFEHLSIAGLELAVQEVCRVTRRGICAGFFQMDEVAQHLVRPVDEYHVNLLSRRQTAELFAEHGFKAQVFHIDTFLRQHVGSGPAHNPNAYTFWLYAAEPEPGRAV